MSRRQYESLVHLYLFIQKCKQIGCHNYYDVSTLVNSTRINVLYNYRNIKYNDWRHFILTEDELLYFMESLIDAGYEVCGDAFSESGQYSQFPCYQVQFDNMTSMYVSPIEALKHEIQNRISTLHKPEFDAKLPLLKDLTGKLQFINHIMLDES